MLAIFLSVSNWQLLVWQVTTFPFQFMMMFMLLLLLLLVTEIAKKTPQIDIDKTSNQRESVSFTERYHREKTTPPPPPIDGDNDCFRWWWLWLRYSIPNCDLIRIWANISHDEITGVVWYSDCQNFRNFCHPDVFTQVVKRVHFHNFDHLKKSCIS